MLSLKPKLEMQPLPVVQHKNTIIIIILSFSCLISCYAVHTIQLGTSIGWDQAAIGEHVYNMSKKSWPILYSKLRYY